MKKKKKREGSIVKVFRQKGLGKGTTSRFLVWVVAFRVRCLVFRTHEQGTKSSEQNMRFMTQGYIGLSSGCE
jgi:hypothetical protein